MVRAWAVPACRGEMAVFPSGGAVCGGPCHCKGGKGGGTRTKRVLEPSHRVLEPSQRVLVPSQRVLRKPPDYDTDRVISPW